MIGGRAYLIQSQSAVASPTVSSIILSTGGTVRPWIYDLLLGSAASPADNALTWYVQRSTASGASSAYTPAALDSSDPASISAAGTVITGEPTYTSGKILLHWAANQRSAPRMNFDPTAPLLVPATNNAGLGLYCVHASFTGVVDASMYFKE